MRAASMPRSVLPWRVQLHAAERPPAKVLVLDCDQTLWKGVSAEDGVSGVVVDAPRRAIQEFALRQRAAGVLICLCSKNVEEDVYAVLDGHPDMLLRREHVTAARINWESKSANLRALARELNLGLDSFVFLDDSAVECAEVRARAPEVLTLALPEDASRIASFLDHVWAFEGAAGTKEDAKRAELYRQEAERGALRQSAASFGDFIAGLGLEVKLFRAGAGAGGSHRAAYSAHEPVQQHHDPPQGTRGQAAGRVAGRAMHRGAGARPLRRLRPRGRRHLLAR